MTNEEIKKSKIYLKNMIADLEDDKDHYESVEHDKAKVFFLNTDIENNQKCLDVINQLQQENAKQKEILDILKPLFKSDFGCNTRRIKGNYRFIHCDSIIFEKYNKEQYDLLKEWLDNE